MVTRTPPVLVATPRSDLRALLATERDWHRRQRELVRASLVACPAKRRTPRALTY
jgi:hypothetical protein